MDNFCIKKVNKKKILVVSSKFPPAEYSGSGLRAFNTYKRLEKKYAINWDVVTNSMTFTGNTHYKYGGKEVFRIASPVKIQQQNFFLKKLSILLSIIWETLTVIYFLSFNSKKYKLLHTFGNTWSIGIFTLFFFYKKKPILREVVNDIKNPFYPSQIDFLIKKIFIKKNLIVAISKKIAIICKNKKIKNVWQRPNPVNEKKFFPDQKNKYKFRKSLTKFTKKDIVLSSLGSLVSRKNHIFLLDVLKILPKKFKLIIVGPINKKEVNYFKDLKKKVLELGLKSRVQIKKKFISNIDEYIKLSDVYLFPSKSEGLGTSILEAQACGIPIVSNLLKNITDCEIKDGYGGYCASLDPKNFKRKIELSLKIPKKKLIKNSEMILKRASSEVIDKEYYYYISNILKKFN